MKAINLIFKSFITVVFIVCFLNGLYFVGGVFGLNDLQPFLAVTGIIYMVFSCVMCVLLLQDVK